MVEILIETIQLQSGLFQVFLTFLTDVDSFLHFQGTSSTILMGKDVKINKYEILTQTRLKVCRGRVRSLRKRRLPLVKKDAYSNLIPLTPYYKDKMIEWILTVEKKRCSAFHNCRRI